MPEGTNRQWVLSQRPKGLPEDPPRAEHFRWVESSIPNPGPGQVLVRNFWISMLPTNLMALTASSEEGGLELGAVIPSVTASRVIESRLPEYAPGDLLAGFAGWEDYSVVEGHGYIDTMKIPPEVPLNFALSALGIDGMVAYFGVLEVARPRKGETFVISAAAGGVGSIAAQIAKIHGLRVIGIAGGKEKCDWLVNEARVAAAIDHRTEQVGPRLDELCPKGIDIYFDNVGGPILDEALARLRRNGRIVVCGGTARYAQSTPLPGPANLPPTLHDEWEDGRTAREGLFRSIPRGDRDAPRMDCLRPTHGQRGRDGRLGERSSGFRPIVFGCECRQTTSENHR